MGAEMQPFEIQITAEDQISAREKIYSNLGSRHRVPRGKIAIERLEEIGNSADSPKDGSA